MADQILHSFLTKLHVSPEAAAVYLALFERPVQTAVELAKRTGIPKTTVYRRLEELQQQGLIEERVEEYKKTFAPASADLLELLVVKQEQELAEVRGQLPAVSRLLRGQLAGGSNDPETKVLFYSGRDGIQQMIWNVLHARSEVVGYTFRDLGGFVGRKFYQSWREEFTQRELSGRDLFSDQYIQSKFEADNPAAVGWDGWESRYIEPEVLDISHQMDVYDDVVGMYNWVGSEIFGIEIHNAKVADMQRQGFELMWDEGRPLGFEGQLRRYEAIERRKADGR